MASTVKKVLVLTFTTSDEDVKPQITLSKPKFDMSKDELGRQMDAIIATGVFEKKNLPVAGKKSATYKTTTTDDITLV